MNELKNTSLPAAALTRAGLLPSWEGPGVGLPLSQQGRLSRLILILFALLALASCTTDDDGSDNRVTGQIAIRHYWGSAGFDNTDTLTTANGRRLVVTEARVLVSRIRLDNDAGSQTVLDDVGFVINGPTRTPVYQQYRIPESAFRGPMAYLRINIGLDSTTNHQDPTTLAQDHPLNVPEMHWVWNPERGYIFVKFEGQIDTAAVGQPAAWVPIEVHITTDAWYTPLRLAIPSGTDEPSFGQLQLAVRWDRLFNNMSLPNGLNGLAGEDSLRVNLPNLLSLE